MSRFLVTTTIRHTKPGEASGHVYVFDPIAKRVTSQCPIIEPPYLDADPNPRGGMRGAKGIAFGNNTLFLANASIVYRFDSAWRCLGTITHPSCATIHDLAWHNGGLWVTSCSNDLLFQFDLAGRIRELFDFRACKPVQQALNWYPPCLLQRDALLAGRLDFRDPRTHCHETHDGGHLNSLCVLPNGDLLALLGLLRTRHWNYLLHLKNFLEKRGAWLPLLRALRPLVNLLPFRRVARSDVGVSVTTARAAVLRIQSNGTVSVVKVLTGRRMPTHSLCALPDGTALLADTTDGTIEHFHSATGQTLGRLKVTEQFLRGLHATADGQLLAGSQRDLLLVDWQRKCVLDRLPLAANPNATVYDIKPLPDDFDDLPATLSSSMTPASASPSGGERLREVEPVTA